jgi:hypothetical protein
MNPIRTSLLLMALFLPLAPTALASTTWYVDGSNGSDSNNCMSSQTACRTIGHAISLASSDDSIMVAAAIYVENLTIGISVNVIGSGASTTIIDGARRATVVTISSASALVTLAKVTITNGVHGIYNRGGTLILNNSAVSHNSAAFGGAGIYNGNGILMINNSTVSANSVGTSCIASPCPAVGGGIYSSGTLRISNSTIGPNSVHLYCSYHAYYCQAAGGGIAGGGTLTINNSTIVGNGVYVSCTSHFCGAFGGGMAISGSTMISNSTLSGNWVSPQGTGSNIYGSATLQNSILANGPNGGNCAGTITTNGYNLSSDNSCNFNGPGDMNNTDPKLGTLGYFGGETQTIPLLSGSPAIDAGNPSGCTDGQGNLLKTDQRGMPRPDKEDAGGCDMGAYESQND